MNIKLPLLGFGLAALILSLSTWTPVVVISTHEDNIDHNSGWPEMKVSTHPDNVDNKSFHSSR